MNTTTATRLYDSYWTQTLLNTVDRGFVYRKTLPGACVGAKELQA